MTMEILASRAKKLGLELTHHQLVQFEIYSRELLDWNHRMNLTAITDYADVQIKHFLDSLTVFQAWPERSQHPRVIDVGTGAGFPGIPLKILMPDLSLTLLEATTKKTVFLKHVLNLAGLLGVDILPTRAEDSAHDKRYREKFDVVLARAVSTLPALVELTLPFCKIGGRFISQKKGDINEEINQSLKAAKLMGGKLLETKPITLEEFPDQRMLVIYEKVSATP